MASVTRRGEKKRPTMKNRVVSILVVLMVAAVLALPGIRTATAATGNATIVSSDSTPIVGVYNKADHGSVYVPSSMLAVRVSEPKMYPDTYPDEYVLGESLDSTWDNGVGGWFQTNSTADWIWETKRAAGPQDYNPINPLYDADASIYGRVVEFASTFELPGIPGDGFINIAADNGWEVWVNDGTHYYSDTVSGAGWAETHLWEPDLNSQGWQTYGHFTIPASQFCNGTNVLHVLAGNEYYAPEDGNTSIPPYLMNPGGVIFQLDVSYETGLGFTHTWGYWKTHSSYGPAPYDNAWDLLDEDGQFFISGQTYHQVLQTDVRGGSAYYQLAHQYIAAKLNVLDGAWMGPDVQTAYNRATDLLLNYSPSQVAGFKKGTPFGRGIFNEFNQLASILDDYNKGEMGTPHAGP
jgi:hypothetical protein